MNQKVTAQSQQHLKLNEMNLNCNLLVRDNLRFDFGDFKHIELLIKGHLCSFKHLGYQFQLHAYFHL